MKEGLKKHEGIIAEIKENPDECNQIFVISNANADDIINKTINELMEITLKNDGAYYSFKANEYEKMKVGTEVIVYWNGYQEDSDLPQRNVESIDVVPE